MVSRKGFHLRILAAYNHIVYQIANPSSKNNGATAAGDIELAKQHPKTTFILKDQVYNNYKYYDENGVYKTIPY